MDTRTLQKRLSDVLQQAVARLPAPDARQADPQPSRTTPSTRWELSRDASFGDLSNPIAFRLAAAQQQPPVPLAQHLARLVETECRAAGLSGWIERVEAKAGFLNVFLSQRALIAIVQDVLRSRDRYGALAPSSTSPTINLEFLSANPTGPLSVAHGRQAVVGDVLARLLRSQGGRVTTEYYLNDEGRQIELLGRSLRARYLQALGREEPFPEDGYHGAYVTAGGQALRRQHGDRLVDQPLSWFMEHGMVEQLAQIKRDVDRFGLRFDVWTSQRWLRTSGKIDAALGALRARGVV